MSPSRASLSSIPTSYATVSVGTPQHPLDQKLEAIAAAGFQGIELGFPDLLNFASHHHQREVGNYDYDALCNTAKSVKDICAALKLKVVMLQPFANFEGWPVDSDKRKDAFTRAKGWIQIMRAVGCEMLQVSPLRSLFLLL